MNNQTLNSDNNQKKLPISHFINKTTKQKLIKKFKNLSQNFYYLKKIQKHMIRQLSFSSKMNQKSFEEMFNRFKIGFLAIFGNCLQNEIFQIFDEDSDKYLNEDEQLLIFSTINSKLFFFSEEFIFFGFYDFLPKLEKLQKIVLNLIMDFQSELRQNLYKEQISKFEKITSKKISKEQNNFNLRFTQFQKFRLTKNEDLLMDQNFKKIQKMKTMNLKIKNFKFGKYSQMKEMIIQEKFLSIYGNVEESKNMKKLYKKFYLEEERQMDLNKREMEKKTKNKIKNKNMFLKNILNKKINSEMKKMILENNKNHSLLLRKLSARKNRIKKIQDQMCARANFNFMKQNNVNKLRSKSRLKKDFLFKIKNNHKNYSHQKKFYHSNVFKNYFEKKNYQSEKTKFEIEKKNSQKENNFVKFNTNFVKKNSDFENKYNFEKKNTNFPKRNFKIEKKNNFEISEQISKTSDFKKSLNFENTKKKSFEKKINFQIPKKNDIEELKIFKNSDFNIRFHLRKGNKEFNPVNIQFKSKNKDVNDIDKIKSILSFNNFNDSNRNYKLCHLYNDNLELKQKVFSIN